MNIYLAIQGILLVYKKIHNKGASPHWHSCSSLQSYKNRLPQKFLNILDSFVLACLLHVSVFIIAKYLGFYLATKAEKEKKNPCFIKR